MTFEESVALGTDAMNKWLRDREQAAEDRRVNMIVVRYPDTLDKAKATAVYEGIKLVHPHVILIPGAPL